MDPKLIIAAIAQNRQVMDDQVKSLLSFCPSSPTSSLPPDFCIEDMLAMKVRSNYQNAMNCIQHITEVEKNTRASFTNSISNDPGQVLDAEFDEVQE
jgi:hypothetical protein